MNCPTKNQIRECFSKEILEYVKFQNIKLQKMFQDIKTHVIQFYEEFYPQFETLYSILRKSPRGPVGKSALSSSSLSSVGFYVLLTLTLLMV